MSQHRVHGGWLWIAGAAIAVATGCSDPSPPSPPWKAGTEFKSGVKWPEPKVVDPGPPGGPPADAIVLFDGTDMSAWTGAADGWEVKDGVVTVKGISSSDLHYAETKQEFGDCQLHLEFATPDVAKGRGQDRGNSGVYLMGRYEVQILDSYENKTYFDGQCGAIYKQQPPLVNVCRKPGEWQTYDIIFKAPRFDASGKVVKPAFITVLHNGVLIQDHFELPGGTFWDRPPHYEPHPERARLQLQDHGNPVKFRNIWIRDLEPPQPDAQARDGLPTIPTPSRGPATRSMAAAFPR